MGIFMNTFLAAGPAIAIVDMTMTFFGPPGRDFAHNIAKVAFFITTMPLMQGMAELLWMLFIVRYGRRPVYMLSFLMYTATSIWAGVAKLYGSELAARIMMGVASGAGECLAPLTIADLFFLHPRGRMMS
jgi:MFS family permease